MKKHKTSSVRKPMPIRTNLKAGVFSPGGFGLVLPVALKPIRFPR